MSIKMSRDPMPDIAASFKIYGTTAEHFANTVAKAVEIKGNIYLTANGLQAKKSSDKVKGDIKVPKALIHIMYLTFEGKINHEIDLMKKTYETQKSNSKEMSGSLIEEKPIPGVMVDNKLAVQRLWIRNNIDKLKLNKNDQKIVNLFKSSFRGNSFDLGDVRVALQRPDPVKKQNEGPPFQKKLAVMKNVFTSKASHHYDAAEKKKALEEVKRMIPLAVSKLSSIEKTSAVLAGLVRDNSFFYQKVRVDDKPISDTMLRTNTIKATDKLNRLHEVGLRDYDESVIKKVTEAQRSSELSEPLLMALNRMEEMLIDEIDQRLEQEMWKLIGSLSFTVPNDEAKVGKSLEAARVDMTSSQTSLIKVAEKLKNQLKVNFTNSSKLKKINDKLDLISKEIKKSTYIEADSTIGKNLNSINKEKVDLANIFKQIRSCVNSEANPTDEDRKLLDQNLKQLILISKKVAKSSSKTTENN